VVIGSSCGVAVAIRLRQREEVGAGDKETRGGGRSHLQTRRNQEERGNVKGKKTAVQGK